MKKILLAVALALFLGSQLNAQTERKVQGRVTDGVNPLKDVVVKVLNKDIAMYTDQEGYYSIQVETSDILEFSFLGMKDVQILVEDVTQFLNVELALTVSKLDEVTVSKTIFRNQKRLREDYNLDKNIIRTAHGFIDKETINFSVTMLYGKDLNPIGLDLASVLQYKVAGLRVYRPITDPLNPIIYLRQSTVGFYPAIYDVDGMVFQDFPNFLMTENIERLAILRGLGAAVKYGTLGRGGVIVINTKGANVFKSESQIPYDLARLRGNTYDGLARGIDQLERNQPTYLKELYGTKTKEQAKLLFSDQLRRYKGSAFFLLDAYKFFVNNFGDVALADTIINQNKTVFKNNAVILKALAYHYQKEGRHKKANEVFKEIFIIRPNYIQSYLDMANSYRDIGEYQSAASLYARYDYLLNQGFLKVDADLGLIMTRESNNLIMLHGSKLLKTPEVDKIILDDEFKGTRLVFEWNDSEAEFELEFVNPEGNQVAYEHSLLAIESDVAKQKRVGLSTKEFLIDGSIQGKWQANLTYFGNKSTTPSYLKATIYYNYGSPSQRKEIKLFKLSVKDVKQELFSVVNGQMLALN